MEPTTLILLVFIFVLSAFLGFELITKVPSQLHTPLMSGSNAISGITIVGALLAMTQSQSSEAAGWLGFAALILASINVVGGYMVTDRMLSMFRKKEIKKD
ncbi:MAG: NAD(P) transhydrogenase subunit alpha [Candidatus Promineifilaceae bacterium]|jgi:NAD(P) transhydrogenase subunit alpha